MHVFTNQFFIFTTVIEPLKFNERTKMKDIPNKLRTLREANGFKQEYVGNILGITQAGYSKIESGEVDLTITYLTKLANLYKVTPEQILGWDGKITIGTIQNLKGVVYNNGTYNESPYEDRLKVLENKLEEVFIKLNSNQ